MTQAQRLIEKTKQIREQKNLIKKMDHDYKELTDKFNALSNDYDLVSKQNEDLRNRFERGGIVYTINNGYVSSAVEIPAFSEWTYKQPVPSEIGSALYNTFPFVKIEDRQLVIDTKQKSKYEGARK